MVEEGSRSPFSERGQVRWRVYREEEITTIY